MAPAAELDCQRPAQSAAMQPLRDFPEEARAGLRGSRQEHGAKRREKRKAKDFEVRIADFENNRKERSSWFVAHSSWGRERGQGNKTNFEL